MADAAPMIILLIIAGVMGFELMFLGSQAVQADTDAFGNASDTIDRPDNSTGGVFGFVDAAGSILASIWNGVKLFFDLLTFGIPGAPLAIRFPIGVVMTGGLLWSILGLIR